jgi:uncharacterized repeat protein (TIGR03847 family)
MGRPNLESDDVSSFPDGPDHDFRVGRMAIGFDPSTGTVVLHIFDLGRGEEEEEPDVQVRITGDACAGLNNRLQQIIAAGRPQCPLCGTPLDPEGHACIRSNGHSTQPIPELGTDED